MHIQKHIEHVIGHMKRPEFTIYIYIGKGLETADVNTLKTISPVEGCEDDDLYIWFCRDVNALLQHVPFTDFYEIKQHSCSTSLCISYKLYYYKCNCDIIIKRVDISDDGNDAYIIDGNMFTDIDCAAWYLQSLVD